MFVLILILIHCLFLCCCSVKLCNITVRIRESIHYASIHCALRLIRIESQARIVFVAAQLPLEYDAGGELFRTRFGNGVVVLCSRQILTLQITALLLRSTKLKHLCAKHFIVDCSPNTQRQTIKQHRQWCGS